MSLKLVTDESDPVEAMPELTPEEVALFEKTSLHPVVYAKVCPVVDFPRVPDIMNATDRKRRFAMIMSLNGIPNFAQRRDPIIIPSEADSFLVEADNIEDLRQRIMREVDLVLNQISEVSKKMQDSGHG